MVARFYWLDNTRVLNLQEFLENLKMVLHIALHKIRFQANWSDLPQIPLPTPPGSLFRWRRSKLNMFGIFCSCSSQAPGNCSFSQFPIGLSLTLQVPQVLSSSRSGHLCSWHFAADGVVVDVRGTTVPKGVVMFTMESLVVVSSVRSSYSHPDLLVIQQHHPTFSDHTSPQHWTFTFWATTAI